MLARIANLLNRDEDEARYLELAARTLAAWRTEFVDPNGDLRIDTQAELVRALALGMVPDASREQVADRLVALIREADTHLTTGFLATPFLLDILADHGHHDVAYELLFQDTPPSWLAMIDRGATTIWEDWEGIDDDGKPHASLNHYSKGAVVSFLHRRTAGLRMVDDFPAYRRFLVQPEPGGGITWAEAIHDSPYGRIAVSWQMRGRELTLDLVVPPGTTAEVVLPDGARHEAEAGTHSWRSSAG